MQKEIKEECGVFGIFAPKIDKTIGYKTYLALCALQHRGEESCGIAVNNDGVICCKKDLGLVSEVFKKHEIDGLIGKMSLGQVRYSGISKPQKENAQPLVIKFISGNMAIAYNGNLVNSLELKKRLQKAGVIFQSGSDAEIICSLIARERVHSTTTQEAILKIMKKLKGAYSFVVMTKRKMIAVRDPHGFRPLCIGTLGKAIVFSSETCALNVIDAKCLRDINPGEVYCKSDEKTTLNTCDKKVKPACCIFEYIYSSRPDSYFNGVSIHEFRKETGRYLARNDKNDPIIADIVCGVPDSGIDAALGYAEESKIPYGMAFIKNKYVGRTFIKPANQRRDLVKVKLSALQAVVENKIVLLVDDSIVRGTTTGPIIKLLKKVKKAGAKEVHVRIASPPFIDVCPFGTDVDRKSDLIACSMSLEEIRQHVGADSLKYLPVDDLNEIAIRNNIQGHCNGCFTGKYPMKVPKIIERDNFE